MKDEKDTGLQLVIKWIREGRIAQARFVSQGYMSDDEFDALVKREKGITWTVHKSETKPAEAVTEQPEMPVEEDDLADTQTMK